MMRRGERAVWAVWVLAGVLLGAPALAAEDENVVGEVLEILKQRGLVDEQEYERLSLKNAAYEEHRESEGFMSRIEWSGDMRMRLENFWYDRDPVANEQNPSRYNPIEWGRCRGKRSDGDYADYGAEVQISQFRK